MTKRLESLELVRVLVAVAVVNVGCDPAAALTQGAFEQDSSAGELPLAGGIDRLMFGAVAAVSFAFVLAAAGAGRRLGR